MQKGLYGGSRRSALRKREALAFYLFVAPWAIGFLAFVAAPTIVSLGLSFTAYDIVRPPRFVGLGNYAEILRDPLVAQSLFNTAYIVFYAVPLGMVIAFALALLLNQKVWGMAGYRTAFYMPSIVPMVGSALIWRYMLQPSWGPVNGVLGLLGLSGPGWLASEVWSKPSLILVMLWGSGGTMVVYLAGLQDIPQALYEAAELDGATWLGKLRYVTVPLMTPVIFFTLVMRTISIFQVFGIVFVMTDGLGGPLNSTLVYLLYVYRQAFAYMRMGFACGLAWILLLIVLALTLLQFRLAGSWVYSAAD